MSHLYAKVFLGNDDDSLSLLDTNSVAIHFKEKENPPQEDISEGTKINYFKVQHFIFFTTLLGAKTPCAGGNSLVLTLFSDCL